MRCRSKCKYNLVEISQPPVIVATVTTEAFADAHNIEVTTTTKWIGIDIRCISL